MHVHETFPCNINALLNNHQTIINHQTTTLTTKLVPFKGTSLVVNEIFTAKTKEK